MLKISKDLELPLEAATQTFAILARKRVGKTYTASVMAEEMCEAKIPFVVLDPTGAWYGLRSSKDGKRPGYPVIIIGGAHGDIPLEFTAGKTIAEFVVENPGFYVLDLSGSESDAEQDRFATAFAQRLYRLKDKHREPLHLFVDEADSFAPQSPFPGQKPMLGAFEAIVRRGGIRGIGITLITQRAAVLNKNVLTQAEVLIALQTTGPQDINAVDDWIKRNATAEQRSEFLASVSSLGQGESYVWSPAWLDIFKKIQIRERRTFNSSATPKVGEVRVEPAKLAEVDLDALRERMAATIQQVEANDPKKLKGEIAKLKRDLEQAQKALPATIAEVTTKVEKVEVPVITDDQLAKAVEAANSLATSIEQIEAKLAEVREVRDGFLLGVKHVTEFRDFTAIAPIAKTAPAHFVRIDKPASVQMNGNGALTKAERFILQALFWTKDDNAITPAKVGFYADYRAGTGSFNNALSGLRSKGLLAGWVITSDGVAMASSYAEAKPTGMELREWLRPKLDKCSNEILDVLLRRYPNRLHPEQLAEETASGYKAGTGSFNNGLAKLRSLEAAEGYAAEGVKAADVFFE